MSEKSIMLANANKYIFNKRFQIVLLLALLCQFGLWSGVTSKIKHSFTITPLPPSKLEMSIFSLGDNAFLYRLYGFKLQNAGDTFGEVIPLKDYDYEKLEKWFYALADLDDKAEYVPSIAGFFYSASQNREDNKYIVNFLEDFADKNPEKHWRWYVTASYLARQKLRDKTRGFKIASKLVTVKEKLPIASRAAAILMLNEKDLQTCETINLISDLVLKGDLEQVLKDDLFSVKDNKYNFMFYIIKSRIDKVIANEKLIKKCLLSRNK